MGKVPVSSSALIQRAKRAFLASGEVLRVAREGSSAHSLGPFYTVDETTNAVSRQRLNISDLAEMYLKPHEVLA